ncbi:hypothetical protein J3459_010319 [Metarhizium acridum]|uniref:uncharacterized protein n=1 Tax=Metarhizium acridum TaxID=92637 RepID=UPI001C6CB1B9|nr:hypothetical protein J3459_020128 [Metarhizium acridum]KAG8422518.1 hypothetical protein J3459_010319 [Metarhizium acridum]KAG8424965.1 hypothetical protein J3458_001712 [Metarhizium acridum]
MQNSCLLFLACSFASSWSAWWYLDERHGQRTYRTLSTTKIFILKASCVDPGFEVKDSDLVVLKVWVAIQAVDLGKDTGKRSVASYRAAQIDRTMGRACNVTKDPKYEFKPCSDLWGSMLG